MTSYELDTALSLQKDAFAMGDCLHTSSENLSKLVRWAHSHGTICSLIPGLKHLLTDGAHGSLVAMWGCGAGHAYHWPLSAPCRPGPKERAPCYPDGRGVPGEPPPGVPLGSGAGERFLARSAATAAANKAKSRGGGDQTRDSLCDFSNGSEASETGDDNAEEFGGNLFDMACESSVTDEDGEYESEPPGRRRSRGAPPLPGGTEDRAVKRIKQETSEHYYPVAQLPPRTDSDPRPGSSARGASLGHKPPSGDCPAASSSSSPLSSSPLLASLGKPSRVPSLAPQPSPRHLEQSAAHSCPGLTNQEESRPADASPAHLPPGLGSEAGLGAELRAEHALGSSDSVGEAAGPAPGEMERLRALLQAERSRSALMGQTISSLEQDKQLLQQELTKKAELICDFLQDQLRPEKRRSHPSSQEPGSSHMVPFVEEAAFDSPVLFDSFEEVELHPLDRQRGLKTKRNRDGENTRVRMKNVVGVIARYMASLQEFRRSVSMKVAFDRVGVDRNTISRTAAIAELSLAAPEVFHALAPWDEKEETLAHYSHRCRQAMDDNIKAKIKSMKAKGDLLPIVSK